MIAPEGSARRQQTNRRLFKRKLEVLSPAVLVRQVVDLVSGDKRAVGLGPYSDLTGAGLG